MALIVEQETPITVVGTSDSGPGTFVAIILGLVVVAIIGYMMYAFNNGAPSTTDIHNTTITAPSAPSMPDASQPAPAAPSMPDTRAPAPSAPANQ